MPLSEVHDWILKCDYHLCHTQQTIYYKSYPDAYRIAEESGWKDTGNGDWICPNHRKVKP